METLAHKPYLRIAHKSLAYILVFLLVNMPLWAVSNPTIIGGSAGVNQGGNTTTVNVLSSRAIINWDSLDTNSNEVLQYLHAGGNFAVLNRVVAGGATQFDGTLLGNQGHIIFVNPNGIVFGPSAVISAHKFTASSMDIANEDFMAGVYKFTGDGIGEISNYGDISAEQVTLIGKKVLNAGTITSPGGYTILAAGDSVYLNPEGSDVMVEVSGITLPDAPSVEGLGDVVNTGTIEAIDGQIIMAAGDTFSRAIEGVDGMTVAVDGGVGRVGQFGTLTANGSAGDGGSITLTAADTVVLGGGSVTTANAGAIGSGGDIVVYSPDTVLFREGALVEAKGGSESGNGGFFEVSGKQYVETMGDIDLTGTQNGIFLIDPLDLWIVDIDDNIDVDATLTDDYFVVPTNTSSVSQLDVDQLELYLDVANVTLSTLGTSDGGTYPADFHPDYPEGTPQQGDIIFNMGRELHAGTDWKQNPSNSSLIVKADHDIIFMEGSSINFAGNGKTVGSGNVELYSSTKGDSASFDGAVIAPKEELNIHTGKGNITIEAGSGGIDMGGLKIGTVNVTGEEAHLRLYTINGNGVTINYGDDDTNTADGDELPDDILNDFDINVQHLEALGRRYSSVYADSAGDLNIIGTSSLGGAVLSRTNTKNSGGDSAQSYICLIADGDIYIESDVWADADSGTQANAAVWIGAGTHYQDGVTPNPAYEGTVTGKNQGGGWIIQSHADSSSGEKEDAIIRVYGAFIDVDAKVEAKTGDGTHKIDRSHDKVIPGDSGQDPALLGDSDYEDSDNATYKDGGTGDPLYDELISGSRALVDIDVYKDGSCLNCSNRIIFVLNPDADTTNWRTGYTINEISFGDGLDLDVLFNDSLPDGAIVVEILTDYDDISSGSVVFDSSIGENGGLLYIPPSYDDDVQFEWDGNPDNPATFTDIFNYQVSVTLNGETFTLDGSAEVTITVENEVPQLSSDSETIHMDDTANFDLSTHIYTDLDNELPVAPAGTLIIDPDGSPGATIGTYGDSLTLGDVTVPVSDGTLVNPDGDTLTGPDADDIVQYTPLGGYVTGSKDPISIDYTVTDSSIVYASDAPDYDEQNPDAPVVQSETLSVTVTNALPGGHSWLGGDVPMDTDGETRQILPANNNFADPNPEDTILEILIDGPSDQDYNQSFGGELIYNGTNDQYDPDATYTYDATTMGLPGYVGDEFDDFDTYPVDIATNADDRFDVKLWDGQRTYYQDGTSAVLSSDYGTGTISLDITNTPPEGSDLWFVVHMDSQDVTKTDAELGGGFGEGVDVTILDGSVIDNYGNPRTDAYSGTLDYDDTTNTWTYDAPIGDLPGFVGDEVDDVDDYTSILANADNLFPVELSNGEHEYAFQESEPTGDGWMPGTPLDNTVENVWYRSVATSGTVSVDITNELPQIDVGPTLEHMDEPIADEIFAEDQLDVLDALDDLKTVVGTGSDIEVVGYWSDFGIWIPVDNDNPDGTSKYDYTPADGYVDQDSFEVTVWDGQRDYKFDGNGGTYSQDTPDTVTGTVLVEYTNILPEGNGDLGSATSSPGLVITVEQTGARNGTPVNVTDALDPQQNILDDLSIVVPGIPYIGSGGGTLVFDGVEWTYTPADGFVGTETFTILVWDGQNQYGEHIEDAGFPKPVYGKGTVSVTVTPPIIPPPPGPDPQPQPTPELAPVAPLADYEIPKLVGCPVELDAAAAELAVNSDELQLLIANAMATNPNLQPCEACQTLLTAATTLKSMDDSSMAALVQVISREAPVDAPFTPEIEAAVATAFSNFSQMETELAQMTQQELDDYQQYVIANELVEAFVQYVAVLNNDLRLPVGDTMAMVMDKYFGAISESGNPNIEAYLIEQMQKASGAAATEE